LTEPPLKWRLYDLGGNPVADLAAVRVTSVRLACDALSSRQLSTSSRSVSGAVSWDWGS
jgi:hypothetical protein